MDTPTDLDQRIDFVNNETLEATRRIRNVAEETNDIGVSTLVALNEQGERLDNVERRLDEMDVDLKQTDRHLNALEKCCYCFSCGCCRAHVVKTKMYKKVYGKGANITAEEDAIVNQQPASQSSSGRPNGPIIKSVTNDKKEEEMEENMQAVSDVLTNLKSIATDMGTELDRQNAQIDRLERKSDANHIHTLEANRRVRNQLH